VLDCVQMEGRVAAGTAPMTMCFGCLMIASICGVLDQGKRSGTCARGSRRGYEGERDAGLTDFVGNEWGRRRNLQTPTTNSAAARQCFQEGAKGVEGGNLGVFMGGFNL
jgi:hypothetical protein